MTETFAQIKATVLVVTFNHAAFIEAAIDSALAQECDFPFEVLVADDFSTDGTRAVLERYRDSNDPRLRFFLPDRNLGGSGNGLFIAALHECRGEYVAWLDGDDYWTSKSKLQTMVRFLDERPELRGAFHPVEVIGDNEQTGMSALHGAHGAQTFLSAPSIYPPRALKNVYRFEDLLWSNAVPSSGVVYRRSTLPALEPYADVLCLDWVLHLLQARDGGIGCVDRVMGVYRVHDRGVWSRLPAVRQQEEILAFAERIPELFDYEPPEYRRRLAREWSRLAFAEKSLHRDAEARTAAKRALLHGRRSPVNLLRLAAAFTLPAPLLRLLRRMGGGVGRRLRRWRVPSA
jgi:glycosyltransferase involved in cell wall biosynthesis